MKIKNIFLVCMCLLFLVFALCACGKNTKSTELSGNYISGTQETTKGLNKGEIVSQPSVNKANFPDNYIELSNKVFAVVSAAKKEKNGKQVGCDAIKLVALSGGKVTKELKKKIHDEVISAVNAQVKDVECTDASFDVAENDPDMGLLTVTFTYKSTGGVDSKIYNFPLPKK